MRLRRFRALITIDTARSGPDRAFQSGTRSLLVHVCRTECPAHHKYFAAMMTWDEPGDLRPGDHALVTLTVTDGDAPAYLSAGQPFTLWGAGTGHGIISRQVFTDGFPS